MESWMLGPPYFVGERVVYLHSVGPLLSTVRWLGRLSDTYGAEMVAGIELHEERRDFLSRDGHLIGKRKPFECPPFKGLYTPINRNCQRRSVLFHRRAFKRVFPIMSPLLAPPLPTLRPPLHSSDNSINNKKISQKSFRAKVNLYIEDDVLNHGPINEGDQSKWMQYLPLYHESNPHTRKNKRYRVNPVLEPTDKEENEIEIIPPPPPQRHGTNPQILPPIQEIHNEEEQEKQGAVEAAPEDEDETVPKSMMVLVRSQREADKVQAKDKCFECLICYLEIEPGDGVMLRECLHTFCKECLIAMIENADRPEIICPYKDDDYSCEMKVLEREMKGLVTIHEGMDCKEYQRYILAESTDENSIKTREWIDGLINSGDALYCPKLSGPFAQEMGINYGGDLQEKEIRQEGVVAWRMDEPNVIPSVITAIAIKMY
ncbi:RBCK1 [Lepeophtheirus salmonis]|uniref:RBCK1 n=1 Tax=Lepeophtheirus salmonis TaxID=72036 RepID=A0A7R8H4K8_LEPSM|nr:RBCK1 [Lepeophtheirus salmonis]CAF2861143.1 RBCK1 [Lepeophtheirus salmonis]